MNSTLFRVNHTLLNYLLCYKSQQSVISDLFQYSLDAFSGVERDTLLIQISPLHLQTMKTSHWNVWKVNKTKGSKKLNQRRLHLLFALSTTGNEETFWALFTSGGKRLPLNFLILAQNATLSFTNRLDYLPITNLTENLKTIKSHGIKMTSVIIKFSLI